MPKGLKLGGFMGIAEKNPQSKGLFALTSVPILLSSLQNSLSNPLARREGMVWRFWTPFLEGRGMGFLVSKASEGGDYEE